MTWRFVIYGLLAGVAMIATCRTTNCEPMLIAKITEAAPTTADQSPASSRRVHRHHRRHHQSTSSKRSLRSSPIEGSIPLPVPRQRRADELARSLQERWPSYLDFVQIVETDPMLIDGSTTLVYKRPKIDNTRLSQSDTPKPTGRVFTQTVIPTQQENGSWTVKSCGLLLSILMIALGISRFPAYLASARPLTW